MNNRQKRDKFFWVSPNLHIEWPYEDRRAIGMNFNDFRAIDASCFRFEVKGRIYEIERAKALELGKKYYLPGGKLPNLIPLNEFKELPTIKVAMADDERYGILR